MLKLHGLLNWIIIQFNFKKYLSKYVINKIKGMTKKLCLEILYFKHLYFSSKYKYLFISLSNII